MIVEKERMRSALRHADDMALPDTANEPEASGKVGSRRVSVVIPTYNRAGDLEETLASVMDQAVPPLEVVIVDDSTNDEVERLTGRLSPVFSGAGVGLVYMRNPKERGNTTAKNAGAASSKGDIVLFLDDDVTLDRCYVEEILRVYDLYPRARGVQGYWGDFLKRGRALRVRLPFNRMFFLYHHRRDSCAVQPSFRPTYPYPLTTIVGCQWLSGCNQSYRRSVLDEFQFDEKLRRYSPGDDLDFSYRVHKRYPGSLFITPSATLVHRTTPASRTPSMNLVYIHSAYLEYLFRKNIEQKVSNRLIYGWSTIGRVLTALMDDLIGLAKGESAGFHGIRCILGSLRLCREHRGDLRDGEIGFLGELMDY